MQMTRGEMVKYNLMFLKEEIEEKCTLFVDDFVHPKNYLTKLPQAKGESFIPRNMCLAYCTTKTEEIILNINEKTIRRNQKYYKMEKKDVRFCKLYTIGLLLHEIAHLQVWGIKDGHGKDFAENLHKITEKYLERFLKRLHIESLPEKERQIIWNLAKPY